VWLDFRQAFNCNSSEQYLFTKKKRKKEKKRKIVQIREDLSRWVMG
jgi:hypothetical protein